MAENLSTPQEAISQMMQKDEHLRSERDYRLDVEAMQENLMEAEFLNFRNTFLHIQALHHDGKIDEQALEENWKKIEQIAKESYDVEFAEELGAFQSDIKYNQMVYDLFDEGKNLSKEILEGKIKLPKPQIIEFLRTRGYKEMLLIPGNLSYYQQISTLNQAIKRACLCSSLKNPLLASGATNEERPHNIYPIMIDVKSDPRLSYPAKSIPQSSGLSEQRYYFENFKSAIKERESRVNVQGLTLPEYAMMGLYMNATYRQVAPDFSDLNIDVPELYTVLFGELINSTIQQRYVMANWSQLDKKFLITSTLPEKFFPRFAAGFESEAYE